MYQKNTTNEKLFTPQTKTNKSHLRCRLLWFLGFKVSDLFFRKPKITELEEILCQFLDQLSEEKRQLFMSLSDCKVDENEEEKTELGIWRTNNFALGES